MDKDFLDDLIPAQEAGDAVQAEAAPEPAPEPETGSDGPQRDDKGRFAAKGVEPEETQGTVPPTDKLPKEDYKAIREEREKRQAAEARLAALEQQLQSLQAPQEPPAPPPSLWEDEQGWGNHVVGQAVEASAFQAKLSASEIAMLQATTDFADLKPQVYEFVGQNPAVNQQVATSAHPWKTAYDAFKKHQTMQELGAVDLADLEAKIEARIREELAAQQPGPAAVAIPTSLADAQSARVAGQGVAPMTLDDILGRRPT